MDAVGTCRESSTSSSETPISPPDGRGIIPPLLGIKGVWTGNGAFMIMIMLLGPIVCPTTAFPANFRPKNVSPDPPFHPSVPEAFRGHDHDVRLRKNPKALFLSYVSGPDVVGRRILKRRSSGIQDPENVLIATRRPSNSLRGNGTVDSMISTSSRMGNGNASRNVSRNISRNSIPGDAHLRHPVSLLNEMEHHPQYQFQHCTHRTRGVTFQSFSSRVFLRRTNQTFGPAFGRNKKETKRRVATMALESLHNVIYPPTTTDPLILMHKRACSTAVTNTTS